MYFNSPLIRNKYGIKVFFPFNERYISAFYVFEKNRRIAHKTLLQTSNFWCTERKCVRVFVHYFLIILIFFSGRSSASSSFIPSSETDVKTSCQNNSNKKKNEIVIYHYYVQLQLQHLLYAFATLLVICQLPFKKKYSTIITRLGKTRTTTTARVRCNWNDRLIYSDRFFCHAFNFNSITLNASFSRLPIITFAFSIEFNWFLLDFFFAQISIKTSQFRRINGNPRLDLKLLVFTFVWNSSKVIDH